MSRGQQRPIPVGPAGPHVSADDLARFVIDALEPSACRRFERHVMVCGPCGAALAREAAAEVALQAAWPAVQTAIAAQAERPLAPVLPLHPVPAPAVMIAPAADPRPANVARPRAVPVVVARAQTARVAARSGARAVVSSSSWSSLAAAAMTVLFMGYWTDGGRTPGSAARGGWQALDAAMASAMGATMMSAQAFCSSGDQAGEGGVAGDGGDGLCTPVSGVAGTAAALDACGPTAGAIACTTDRTEPTSSAAFTPHTPAASLDPGSSAARGGAAGLGVCRAPAAGVCAPVSQL